MQYVRWVILNIVQFGSLYGGLVLGIDGFANLFLAMIWLEIFVSFLMYSQTMVDLLLKAPKINIPKFVNNFLDIIIIASLIWVSWWFTAICFILAWCVRITVKDRIQKYRAGDMSYAKLLNWE